MNPQRGEPPLTVPQAAYFTVRVPFAPEDLRGGGALDDVSPVTVHAGGCAARLAGCALAPGTGRSLSFPPSRRHPARICFNNSPSAA